MLENYKIKLSFHFTHLPLSVRNFLSLWWVEWITYVVLSSRRPWTCCPSRWKWKNELFLFLFWMFCRFFDALGTFLNAFFNSWSINLIQMTICLIMKFKQSRNYEIFWLIVKIRGCWVNHRGLCQRSASMDTVFKCYEI